LLIFAKKLAKLSATRIDLFPGSTIAAF